MKKLSTYYILFLLSFSVYSFADDISDFQIEGVSIGDSVLDYMSEEKIKENNAFVYKDKKFTVLFYKSSEIYDSVGITFKSKDKNYKIHGVQGLIDFPANISSCYNKQNKIEKEISLMFKESQKIKWDILKTSQNGTYKPTTFDFKKGGQLLIACHHYPKKTKLDHLKISIKSKEYKEYTTLEAVKVNN